MSSRWCEEMIQVIRVASLGILTVCVLSDVEFAKDHDRFVS